MSNRFFLAKMVSATKSGKGSEDLNEDCVVTVEEKNLGIVADGVSEPPGGRTAARAAAGAFARIVKQHLTPRSSDQAALRKILSEAIGTAHAEVFALANGTSSTLTAIWLLERHLLVVHVGDCRVYIFRNGKIMYGDKNRRSWTTDQTVAEIIGTRGGNPGKTGAAANTLVSAVGRPGLQIESKRIELCESDVVLVCSDGLIKAVSEEEMEAALQSQTDLPSRLASLMSKAQAGGARDDVSVLLASPPPEAFREELRPQVSPDFKVLVLKDVEFFKGLGHEDLQILNGIGETRILPSGRVFMKEGEAADTFWVILEGCAEVVENDKAVKLLKNGDPIGENALFHNPHARMSTVRTKTKLTALVLHREDWLDLIDNNSVLAAKIFERSTEHLTRKLSEAHHKSVELLKELERSHQKKTG